MTNDLLLMFQGKCTDLILFERESGGTGAGGGDGRGVGADTLMEK